MKNFFAGKTMILALALGWLLGASSARAQTYTIRVNVPFHFIAADKQYPSGEYTFTVDQSIHTLVIQSRDKSLLRMVPLTPGSEWRRGRELDNGLVRFTTIGNLHVLRGVWNGGSVQGSVANPSSKTLKQAAAKLNHADEAAATSSLN